MGENNKKYGAPKRLSAFHCCDEMYDLMTQRYPSLHLESSSSIQHALQNVITHRSD
jgi:hypothetical protein